MVKPDSPALPAVAAKDDEGFLGRWSRRKTAARTSDETIPAQRADELETEDEPGELNAPEQAEAPPFDPATLPDIDSMDAGADFSVFMQAGVPPALKTKALRKLWRVKPELANLDGLLDYGEDLTGSFKVVDHLKTAYEVGKGFLRDDDQGEAGTEGPDEDGVIDDHAAIAKADDQPAEAAVSPDQDDADMTVMNEKKIAPENPKS